MKPVVVIPTYNELENVEAMADAVLGVLPPEGELLFLDDNSPDGTGKAIDAICARERRVHVMHRKKKEGLGRAYVAGFAEALRMGATHVVEMDCDFSHDPKDVPRLLAALDANAASPADVAIGSRYVNGGKCAGWPFRRWLLSRAGGIFIRFMLGVPVKDPTGGFKCFTRRALETLGDFSSIKSFGYSFQMEMNYRMWQAGLKLVEVPIVFSERRAGSSKISGSIAAESLKMVFRLKFSRTSNEA
ncbi:MAG: polyprenol monophosphomannose synthase [Kiritimatiellae bacterium]|nr:polyprenol monophosphomannose synthase [Kiritimatiellia bacterium]